nr:hypothetical protein [Actinomycetota bacterium]
VRIGSGLIVCAAIAGAIAFAAIEPRLHSSFPSPIDDWSAIRDAPRQLREVARLGNPEEQRYRPGFVVWNALQWHTLDAPRGFVGPQVWGMLRFAILIVGVALLTAVVVAPQGLGSLWRDPGRLLVVGVPVAAVTAPSLAIDLARYGPQEPLLVGCLALGAVLLLPAIDALLGSRAVGARHVAAFPAGLVLWAFGVLQKETSLCVLLLAPFLLPAVRAQRSRWLDLDRRRRGGVIALAVAILLPFVPMLVRTAQLALAEERLYGEFAAAKPFADRLSDQVTRISEVMHSHLPGTIVVVAIVLVTVAAWRRGIDWLSVGLLVSGFAFAVFAAEAGVVASRYYLPTIVLAALALARAAVALGASTVTLAGATLVTLGALQAIDARGYVEEWVATEQAREVLVREAAARVAGGCDVRYTGLNVELVEAVPVLVPLAAETPRDCGEGERFVVVIDPGGPGTESPPDDPILAPCRPEPQPVWSSEVGKIVRCTT